MPTLSSEQLQAIAHDLNDVSAAISQVRLNAIHRGAALNDPQIVQLLGTSLSLANSASSFALQAAEVTLDDVQGVVDTIENATGRALDALATLARLDKALNIGGAVIALAASFFTANPAQIAAAARNVLEASMAPEMLPAAASSGRDMIR